MKADNAVTTISMDCMYPERHRRNKYPIITIVRIWCNARCQGRLVRRSWSRAIRSWQWWISKAKIMENRTANTVPKNSQIGEAPANGEAQNAIKRLQEQIRTRSRVRPHPDRPADQHRTGRRGRGDCCQPKGGTEEDVHHQTAVVVKYGKKPDRQGCVAMETGKYGVHNQECHKRLHSEMSKSGEGRRRQEEDQRRVVRRTDIKSARLSRRIQALGRRSRRTMTRSSRFTKDRRDPPRHHLRH